MTQPENKTSCEVLKTSQVSKKIMPDKAEFDEIKKQLSSAYGKSAYFLIDGYYIAASVVQLGMRLVITVYVNGFVKGKWIWSGKESELDKMPEISRKFYHLKVSNLYNAKETCAWEKFYGSKAKAKANGVYDKYYRVDFCFSSASAFISHIKKNNDLIRILSYSEYSAAALTDFVFVNGANEFAPTMEVEHAA
jgi:hypothetical protein